MTQRHTAMREVNLQDGLRLRQATREDADAVAAFNTQVHRDWETQQPDDRVGILTRDLMSGRHPTCDADDFTVVEDTRTGTIVSSLCLIPQTWSYGGVKFPVGRPELVGTHPDYRRRGLVRAQFDVIHQWSAERGHKMQAITGRPWFYRQFGYEMALTLQGARMGCLQHVPTLDEGEAEPYRVRRAEERDLTFITQVCEQAASHYLVTCHRDQALWRYELGGGRSERNVDRSELRVVESAQGEVVGFFAHPPELWGTSLWVTWYELRPGISWRAVTPSVIRYVEDMGQAYAALNEDSACQGFAFGLGTDHPVYQAVSESLPISRPPYAWYVRIPDLPNFLSHIHAVLERRLAESVLAQYTGELKIGFYRHGVRLAFESGQLIAADQWMPTVDDEGDAKFPDHTFLQLLLGYRDLEELKYAFADCGAGAEASILLRTLFPKQASNVWPVS